MRRVLVPIALITAGLLLSGCAGVTESPTRSGQTPTPSVATTSSSVALWGGPPEPDASGAMAVDVFNGFLQETAPDWADSSLRVTLEYLALADRDPQAFRTTVFQEASPEGGTEATVTVTLEGLLDDSVQAFRYEVMLEKGEGGMWLLVSATRAQRCAEGRGHQDFSPELCV